MIYNFTKMQSLGNDFVMLNGVTENIRISDRVARTIADRKFGIGCDQILVAQSGDQAHCPQMQIFNSDGSEVGQCGNGARCFAIYLQNQGLVDSESFTVKTITTEIRLEVCADGTVRADMGIPEFDPEKIPMARKHRAARYELDIDGNQISFSAMAIGNPHAVIEVNDVEAAPVESLGPVLESHPVFPERANIGFCQFISRNEIRLRVYERGAGETLGCGSGACAAVVCGIQSGDLDQVVKVNLPGGSVWVEWPGNQNQVVLKGPVQTVFTGAIEIVS